ncbi:MAG: helix-turn-helix domain-containing protein [Treponema sp.]
MDIEIIAEVHKVSERIQKLRQEKRMSQMDLAVEAGISQGFLAMIETRRKVPTIMTIFKLAKALNVRAAALMEDSDPDREQTKKEIIDFIQKRL